MAEEWRDIFDGHYKVSSEGRIMRATKPRGGRGRVGGIMALSSGRGGYLHVHITANGLRKSPKVHRLVAEAFLGSAPGMQVNHKDGNKKNNRLENLEWVTCQQNHDHAVRTGLSPAREKNGRAKLSLEQVEMIRASRESLRILSERYGVTKGAISMIRNGRTWR